MYKIVLFLFTFDLRKKVYSTTPDSTGKHFNNRESNTFFKMAAGFASLLLQMPLFGKMFNKLYNTHFM